MSHPRKPVRRRPIAEALEQRVLYSADPIAQAPALVLPQDDGTSLHSQQAGLAATPPLGTDRASQTQADSAEHAGIAHEIAFVDTNVIGYEALVADLQAQAVAGRDIDVVVLDGTRDGLVQISERLAASDRDVDAVHLIGHGRDAAMRLGLSWIDSSSLRSRAPEFASWGTHLSEQADLLLYGCDLAASDAGQWLVRSLAQLSGADVAASTDTTGALRFGGDWQLEFAIGAIESTAAPSVAAQASWDGRLATFTVTNTNDAGAGSLRQAIIDANGSPGADVIDFSIGAPLVGGAHTISLASALPQITESVLIDARTEPDFAGSPVVVLEGGGTIATGLQVSANDSTLRGLVLAGFSSEAVLVDSGAANTVIVGNYIGADVTGLAGAGNGSFGIRLTGAGSGTVIGGTNALDRNLVVGTSGSAGLWIDNTRDVTVIGNYIGVGADGVTALGNTSGVWLLNDTAGSRIGGTTSGEGNVIARNTVAGVRLSSANTSAAIVGNDIFLNIGLGIDLATDGLVQGNDAGDVDVGANELQNFPVLETASTNGSGLLTVTGTLNALAGTEYRIEFFASGTQHSSGHGQAERYLGFVDVLTDGAGDATISTGVGATVAVGEFLTATATRATGGHTVFHETSEFARNIGVVSSTFATVTVDSTSDISDGDVLSLSRLLADRGADGFISLREAITAANNTANGAGADRILFALELSDPRHFYYQDNGGAGFSAPVATTLADVGIADFDADYPAGRARSWWSVQPGSSLPTITDALVIDATSQTGYSVGSPVLEIDGSLAGAGSDGLAGTAGGIELRGLVINRFGDDGIDFDSASNSTVAASYIGTDVSGTVDLGNGDGSGDGHGISMALAGASGNLIGGTASAEGNLISGNFGAGIHAGGSGLHAIRNNYIGTDITGTVALGNGGAGVVVASVNVTVGGVAGSQGNLIAGNAGAGVQVAADSASVEGNLIGTQADGLSALGNLSHGVRIIAGASNATIGSNFSGRGNTIAFNSLDGIGVESGGGAGHSVLGNAIFSNTGLGIDLNDDGLTANDLADGDSGPNDLMNFPVLTQARTDGGQISLLGTLDSLATTDFRIEFFASAIADPSNHGEGRRYLGFVNVSTDVAGHANFNALIAAAVAQGEFVVATSTLATGGFSDFGSSSEFSQVRVAVPPPGITVTPTSGLITTEAGGSASFDVVLDSAPDDDVVVALSVSDASEGSLAVSQLTFTTGNWATPQSVIVTGVNDTIVDGIVAYQVLTAAAVSTDPGYSGLNAADVGLSSTDDDTVNVIEVDTELDIADGDTSNLASLLADRGADAKISLREAIAATNNTSNGPGGADEIRFAIAGAGVHTIVLNAALAPIVDAVVIDGYSQAGASANTLSLDQGIDAQMRIVISGAGAGIGVSGLVIDANDSRIQGLVVNEFDWTGIRVNGSGNVIVGNFVGVNATGSAAAANGVGTGGSGFGDGIMVYGSNTRVGGALAADRNLVSGNFDEGISINGGAGSRIFGNYVGTDATGLAAIGNQGGGVIVWVDHHEIGGVNAGEGNLISGNSGAGVSLESATATDNTVRGNFIGTGRDGSSALANTDGVVVLGARNNEIGGTSAGARNLIAGNTNDNVRIDGVDPSGNRVQGNYIGTNLAGNAAMGATLRGVHLNASNGTFIGGTVPGAGNLIAGHASSDVFISNGSNNRLEGNRIGTSADGLTRIVSTGNAIVVTGASANNAIGDGTADGRNIVASSSIGIELQSGVSGTTIQGNYIGLGSDGSTATGTAVGITVNAATGTSIGGALAGQGNIIGAASSSGIWMVSAGAGTAVHGNYIGTDATGTMARGNGGRGIDIVGNSSDILIGGTVAGQGNVIAHSGTAGVGVDAGGTITGVRILGNRIFDNAGLGIDLAGDGVSANDSGDADIGVNQLQNFAVLSAATTDGVGQVVVDGTLDSTASRNFLIEFFATALADGSGHGEAQRYLGSTTVVTDALGQAGFSATLGSVVAVGEFVSATVTDLVSNETSEFSLNVAAALANQAPAWTVPGAQTVSEDSILTFSVAGSNAISVGDPDAAAALLEVTLTANQGTLTLNGTIGLSFLAGDGTADATLTVRGNLTDLNAALDGLQFLPDADFAGAASVDLMVSDLGNTGNGGPLTDSRSVAVTVNAVNDPPVITAPANQALNEDAPVVFNGLNGNAIALVDVDAAGASLQVDLSVSQGRLSLSGTTGLTFITGTGSNDTSMSFTGSVTDLNVALEGLTYSPNADFNGADALAILVDDQGHAGSGGARTANASIALSVTAQNDPPLLTVPGAQSVTEDTALVLSGGSAVVVADVDAAAGALQVSLSAGAGVLSLSGTSGLAFTNGDGTADASLVFTGSLADINAALDGLVYLGNANQNGVDSITVAVDDQGNTGGGALTASGSVAVTVTPVNDAPVITVPVPQSIDEDTPTTLTGGTAIVLADVDAGASALTLTLAVSNGTMTLATLSGLSFAIGDGIADTNIVVSGTVADLNAALDGLVYTPNSNYNGPDAIQITIADLGATGAGGAQSDFDQLLLNVAAGNNDAPTIDVPPVQFLVEESSLTLAGPNAIVVSDSDAGSASVEVSLSVSNGLLSLSGTSGLAFTEGDGSVDAAMTFTGSLADVNAALDGLVYQPSADFDATETLSVLVSDLGNTGAGGARTATNSVQIQMQPVNDPPALIVPGPQTVAEDTVLTLAGVSALVVSDVDAGAGSVQVTLSVASGALSLAGVAGLTFTTGDGVADASLQFSGTVAAINAALDGLQYLGNANFNGVDTLSVVVDDLGSSGSGGALTASGSVTLTVSAVNDAPQLVVPAAQSTAEDTGLVLAGAQAIVVNDLEVSGGSLEVSLSVASGVLSLAATTGLSFTTGDGSADTALTFSGTVADINVALDGLVYLPGGQFVGADALTILVSDLGAAGAGGPLSTPGSVAIAVSAVNDAPTVSVPGAQTVAEDAQLVLNGTNALVVGDPDAGGAALQVTLSVSSGTLSLVGISGLAFAIGTGTNDTTMTFSGSVANLNAALDGLRYQGQTHFTGTDTLQMVVDDQGNAGAGGVLSASGSVLLTVSPVNDAPVLNLPAPVSVAEDSTLSMSGVTAIQVSDVDAALLQLTLSASQGRLTLAGTTGLTFTVGSGLDDDTLRFSGSATAINAALDGLTYRPNAQFSGVDTLQALLEDLGASGAGGALQASAGLTINVSPTNDAPSIVVPGAQSLPEEGILIFSAAGANALVLADIDAGPAPVRVSLSVAHGSLTLAGLAGITLNAGDGLADVSMTFTGALAAVNAALDGLSYQPAVDYHGSDLLLLSIDDLGNTGAPGAATAAASVDISIGAVNDSPTIAAPAFASTPEDTTLTFSPAGGNAIVLADVDAGGQPVELRLEVGHGSLTLASTANLVLLEGDGSQDRTLLVMGALADLNAALDGLVYLPDSNRFGGDVLSLRVNDLGVAGQGNAFEISRAVAIEVTSVNDAPEDLVREPASFVVEDSPAGTFAGTVIAIDPDDASGFVFSLSDDAGHFAIDAGSGRLSVAGSALPSAEISPAYRLVVRATDPQGASTERVFTLIAAKQSIAPPPSGLREVGQPLPLSSSASNAAKQGGDTDDDIDGGRRAVHNGTEGAGGFHVAKQAVAGTGLARRSTLDEMADVRSQRSQDSMSRRNEEFSAQVAARATTEIRRQFEMRRIADILRLEHSLEMQGSRSVERTDSAPASVGDLIRWSPEVHQGPTYHVQLDTVQVGGAAVSIGVLFYALRAGGLVAAMLTALPAWSNFDPLVVLSRGRGSDGGQPWDQEELDDEEMRVRDVIESNSPGGSADDRELTRTALT